MGDKKPIQAHVNPTALKLSVTGTSASSSSGASSGSPPKTTPSSSITLPPPVVAWGEIYNDKTMKVEEMEIPTTLIDSVEAADFSPVKTKKKKKMTSPK